jgi:signal transduction histidine kinase
LLSDASAALASSLDYEKTLQAVAHLAVPAFADCCVVDLIGENGAITDLSVAHCNPAKEALLRELRRVELLDMKRGAGPENVLATGKLNWKPDFTNADFDAHVTSERARQIHRELGVVSYIAAPMCVRERVLGTLSFCLAESGRRYEEDDLECATELAARAANAVDNARLYRAAERAREEAEKLKAEAEEARVQAESAQAAAEASQAEAEAASRAKDEFLATLSHELRTPLNAILGWSHLMATGQLDEEDSIRAAEVIERNVRVQAQLLGDMFDVSRIITGKLSLNAEPLEVAPVIDNAVEAVLSSAQAKNVSLQVQSERGIIINGDATRLQQIIWNLLSNAVRFTPQDGSITVRLERENSDAKISVQDSGQGIERDFLPFVFDRFRQADSSSTRRYGGMGLGLSIVRHLTEMHGGRVAARSEGLGHGSTFVVHLPLLRDDVSEESATNKDSAHAVDWPQPEHQLLSNDVLAGLRVLVVDDEADSLALACSVLERYGATTQRASSACEALEIIHGETFDILVSDISMPGEDGCDLLVRIRALPDEIKNMPAIALTALARADDRKRVFSSGFQEHLPKPFDPAALVIAVAGLTNRL